MFVCSHLLVFLALSKYATCTDSYWSVKSILTYETTKYQYETQQKYRWLCFYFVWNRGPASFLFMIEQYSMYIIIQIRIFGKNISKLARGESLKFLRMKTLIFHYLFTLYKIKTCWTTYRIRTVKQSLCILHECFVCNSEYGTWKLGKEEVWGSRFIDVLWCA